MDPQVNNVGEVIRLHIELPNHVRLLEVAHTQFGSNSEAGKFRLQFTRAVDLPFAVASFDVAHAIECLVHLDDTRSALQHFERALLSRFLPGYCGAVSQH